jgi:hypothetical protein
MKMKLYALGATIIAALLGVVSFLAMRNRKDKGLANKFKESMENTEAKLHKKAAEEANKEAKVHLDKVRIIAERKANKEDTNMQDAVKNWNDDHI